LHYLKHAFDESDESVVARWVENPYWQYFCGFTAMQHELPLHPTALVKWRTRVGAEKLALLLQETIALALREKQVSPKEIEQVNVDTTVQEKNITHPTDSKLYLKAILKSCCDNRTFAWQSVLRSRQAATHTRNNSSECGVSSKLSIQGLGE
jgi:IS5 family transposase